MTVTAVIGAAFGDEGKGRAVDWAVSCTGKAEWNLVVRYSGGAQSGHTVVRGDRRHVHHHFGSGSLHGAPTYLGPDFIANPMLFFREKEELEHAGGLTDVISSGHTPITTWMDMLVNEMVEIERGAGAHGTVGLGIHETRHRHTTFGEKLTPKDLGSEERAREILEELRSDYYPERLRELGIDPARHPERMEWFDSDLIYDRWVAEAVRYADALEIADPEDISGSFEHFVFEGSQGLLLDEKSQFFPHVTHSRVGAAGLVDLAQRFGIEEFDFVHYCMRSYLTRHGAGPLPGEDPEVSYHDDTNVPHPWQGTMRFGEHTDETLDLIFGSISKDLDVLEKEFELDEVSVVVSHLDQKFDDDRSFKDSRLCEMITDRTGRDDRISESFWGGWGPTSEDLE